ncbi:zinc-ribbon domain-containing protein [Methanobrevibacter sp.]
MTKQCFFCGYPNRDDAVRCINCGQKLVKYWDKSGGRPKLVDKR